MSQKQVRRGVVALATAAVVSPLVPAATAGAASPATADGASAATAARQGTTKVRLRVANQKPRSVTTTRSYAAGLLRDEGVSKKRKDIVEVRRDGRVAKPANRQLRNGDVVRLVRVTTVTNTARKPIKPRTVEQHTTKLKPGRRKVVAKGRPGVAKVIVKRTRHNYEVVDTDRTQRVLRAPKPRRVLVGRSARFVPGTNHLNWGALANCESGGNPRAVNPAGYYGLYQFDTGTWRSVGGSGLPSRASAPEQTYRAKLLYKQRGRSPWPSCGRLL